LNSEYEAYLGSIRERLSQSGFDIQEKLKVGDFATDLFAFDPHRLRNSNIDIYVAFSVGAKVNMLKSFSEMAFQHAISYEMPNSLRSIYFFPTVCSPAFDEDIKDYVRKFSGFIPLLRWTGLGAEHPVLVELNTRGIVHNERRPFYWGRTAVRNAIKLASDYLAFQ
jgi:hypothetical protein